MTVAELFTRVNYHPPVRTVNCRGAEDMENPPELEWVRWVRFCQDERPPQGWALPPEEPERWDHKQGWSGSHHRHRMSQHHSPEGEAVGIVGEVFPHGTTPRSMAAAAAAVQWRWLWW